MRWLKRILLVLAVLFLAAQFVRPERTNPPVDPSLEYRAPAHVQPILERACNDCHSHRTRWPWYSNITPFNWYLVDHVNEGRAHLNFSEFRRYDRNDARKLLDEMCEEVEEGHMPLPEYLWLHRGARLSEEEKRTLCEWTRDSRRGRSR